MKYLCLLLFPPKKHTFLDIIQIAALRFLYQKFYIE